MKTTTALIMLSFIATVVLSQNLKYFKRGTMCVSVNDKGNLYRTSGFCSVKFEELSGAGQLKDEEGNCFGPRASPERSAQLASQPCSAKTMFRFDTRTRLLWLDQSKFCVHQDGKNKLVLWDVCDENRSDIKFRYLTY